jgi:light-regulated signal transduction histidine kinase (bacteriophytochrome)
VNHKHTHKDRYSTAIQALPCICILVKPSLLFSTCSDNAHVMCMLMCCVCADVLCVRSLQELRHKAEMHRLLRTISHEIRNPLQGILSNTQALISLTTTADQRQALHLLNDNADATASGSTSTVNSVSSKADVDAVAAAASLSCSGSRLSNSVLKDNLEGMCAQPHYHNYV